VSAIPLLNAQAQYTAWLGLPSQPPSITTVHLLGIAVSVGALICACVLLARPAVRNLFARR